MRIWGMGVIFVPIFFVLSCASYAAGPDKISWKEKLAQHSQKKEAELRKKKALGAIEEFRVEKEGLDDLEKDLKGKRDGLKEKLEEERQKIEDDQRAIDEERAQIRKEIEAAKEREASLSKKQNLLEGKKKELKNTLRLEEAALKREKDFLEAKRLELEDAMARVSMIKPKEEAKKEKEKRKEKADLTKLEEVERPPDKAQEQPGPEAVIKANAESGALTNAKALLAEADTLYKQGLYEEAARKYREAREGL